MSAAPVTSNRYSLELDGLRAFAILSVMVYHARNISSPGDASIETTLYGISEGGWIGVDLFFVLSGFLITGILLDAKASPSYFKGFYVRRALRILPLYYIVVAVAFVAVSVGITSGTTDAAPYYVGYVQNWLKLSSGYRVEILAHFWSLAIEEQFYIVWPLLVFVVPRRWSVALCVVFLIGSCVGRYACVETGLLEAETTYYLTPIRMDGLALGGLIAALVRTPHGSSVLRRAWIPSLALGAGIVVAIVLTTEGLRHEDRLVTLWGFLPISLACGALVTATFVLPEQGRYRTLLRTPALRWIGRVSYGAYVFHCKSSQRPVVTA